MSLSIILDLKKLLSGNQERVEHIQMLTEKLQKMSSQAFQQAELESVHFQEQLLNCFTDAVQREKSIEAKLLREGFKTFNEATKVDSEEESLQNIEQNVTDKPFFG